MIVVMDNRRAQLDCHQQERALSLVGTKVNLVPTKAISKFIQRVSLLFLPLASRIQYPHDKLECSRLELRTPTILNKGKRKR